MKSVSQRWEHTRTVLRKKPYRVLIWPLSLLYLVANYFIYRYMYNNNILDFYTAFPPWYTTTFTTLTVIISALFGLVITLFIAKIREVRMKSAGFGIAAGLFGGLAAGCPGCVFGLFPVVAGALGFGGGLTLAVLPWNGIELQVLTALMLLVSLFFLAEETTITCDLPRKT